MMLRGNLNILILFILLDLFGLETLWGENIFRRTLHHFQNGKYNPNKIPWIRFFKNRLEYNDIQYLNNLCNNLSNTCKRCNQGAGTMSKTLSKLYGGLYSKRTAIYYDDLDKKTQRQLDEIGNRMKYQYENIIGKKLYLGDSNFRCCILRYEGIDAEFTLHYDTEDTNCYRSLFLFNGEGEVPPFIYYDKNGKMKKKQFDVGDGLFFQGTKTYHGVHPSKDPNMKRYMVGWQYSTKETTNHKSFCSELRTKPFRDYIFLLLPYVIFTNILVYIVNRYFKVLRIKTKYVLLLTILVSLTIYFLPPYLPKSIGTGLSIKLYKLFLFLLFCIINSIVAPVNGLLLYCYILITEMFLPRNIVGNTLKGVGH